ncbi:hypothetical protein ACJJIQ_07410 [Microbulbifer sp. ANSA003]|uniref:hypothetical protein n=1 Tax=Microbulbifer sp. ANSA003 TaxID=3243360 RepID=UPI004042AD72
MEDFIGIIFILLFVEVIYWGISYSTGYLLTPIVSFGKWRADKIIKDKGTGKKRKHQTGFTLIERSGQVYLGAMAVCILGMCFWLIVILVMCLI